jgi:hypothetical protein
MSRVNDQPTQDHLSACGLVLLGAVHDDRLPSPEWAWHVTAGVQTPTAAVSMSVADLGSVVDAEWLRLSRQHHVLDEQDTFLIALSRSQPWERVRLSDHFRLAEHLAGDDAPAGHAEFVTMATDGSVMCGVTTEEYDVWLVVDSELLHTPSPSRAPAASPEPAPSEVDLDALQPMQVDRLFGPDRLTPPLRDGWVLLGFHRLAKRVVRLHELPDTFSETTASAWAGRHITTGGEGFELSDDQAQRIGDALGVPVDTQRLVYSLEYQTAAGKAEQSSGRRSG